MRAEAASAGIYSSPWGEHPRLQILTIEELLNGKQPDAPPTRQVGRTFRRAPSEGKGPRRSASGVRFSPPGSGETCQSETGEEEDEDSTNQEGRIARAS